MTAKISLVITSHNRDRYLGSAIASVLRQTYSDFELLVWIDGSTDRTADIAQHYATSDARVRVVIAEHLGHTPALQAAIAQTTGEYIGWVDDDDLLSAEALRQTVAVLESAPSVGMVYTDYLDINLDGKVLGYGNRCQIPYSPQRLLVDFMTFHFRLMRRSYYEQVGGLNAAFALAEDYDLCLRLSEVTQIQRVRQPLYYYRNHTHTLSNQQRQALLEQSQQAIVQALWRRKLAHQWEIELRGDRFHLQRKSALASALPTASRGAGIFLATLPLVGIAAQPTQATPLDRDTEVPLAPPSELFPVSTHAVPQETSDFVQSGIRPETIAIPERIVSEPDIAVGARAEGEMAPDAISAKPDMHSEASAIAGDAVLTIVPPSSNRSNGMEDLAVLRSQKAEEVSQRNVGIPREFPSTAPSRQNEEKYFSQIQPTAKPNGVTALGNAARAIQTEVLTKLPPPETIAPEYAARRPEPEPILVAQAITPANDGTGTIVIPQGNQLNITGGQTSRNGANLFHSFSQFGLSPSQIANFQSNPQIQNILGRINGGSPSLINGLIQVTGSNANLYLMNPAGIVFGANAQLNVPGSFTATTADAIGFAGGWFDALGATNYSALNGTPTTFAFNLNQPGAIVNAGNLSVGQGQALNLVGGTVASTGQLTAPGGQIMVAAVPGTSLVRISQPGSPLSLEIEPISQASPSGLTPLTLPELLTGPAAAAVPSLTASGTTQAQLTASGTPVPISPGTALVSGSINVTNLTLGQTGGSAAILGNKVGLISAKINASGASGGGTVLVGGDYQGKGSVPNAARTYVSQDSVIHADAFTSGNGGKAIVWADNTTAFNGNITAKGGHRSGSGGLVEVSGKQTLLFRGTADLSAPQGTLGNLLLDPQNITIVAGKGYGALNLQDGALPDVLQDDFLGQDITLSQNALQTLSGNANVILQATDNVTINSLGILSTVYIPGSLTFQPGIGSITFQADANADGVGNFSMNPLDTINTSGRSIAISGRNVQVGNINTTNFSPGSSQSGSITLTASNLLTTRRLDASGAIGGDILLTGDEIDLLGGGFSVLSNGGSLVLQPATPGQNVIVGGGIGTAALDLDATDISAIGAGYFASTTIGRNNGSGTITVSTPQFFSGSLLVQSPQGAIVIDANLASSDAMVLSAATTTLNADVATEGATATDTLTIDSPQVILGNDVKVSTTTDGNGADITFTGAINGVHNLFVDAGFGYGTAMFGGTIGNLTSLSSLIVLAGNSLVGNNITTTGNGIFFASPVTLTNSAIFNAGTGTIAFFPSLSVGNYHLNLTADEIDFSGSVTATGGTLLLQPFTSNLAIDIGGVGYGGAALDLNQTDLAALANTGGFSSVTIGQANGGSPITFTGNATFVDPVIVQAPTSTGSITSTGTTITGSGNASITLIANQTITTGNMTAPSGITLVSNQGAIDSTNGILSTATSTGNSGTIALTASHGSITSGLLDSAASQGAGGAVSLIADRELSAGTINAQGNTVGGKVNLVSNRSNVTASNITTSASGSTGGAIALNASQGNVISGDLDASGLTQGGNVSVVAQNTIQTGSINTRASLGDGGDVTIDPLGDVQVSFINAQGGRRGIGGNVDITTQRFFRATSTFVDQNQIVASISTAGGLGGGSIIIRHGGGAARVPFVVGSGTTNGTAGAITTGNQPDGTIAPLRSFPGSHFQDIIQIITQDFDGPPQNHPAPLLGIPGGSAQLPCLDSGISSVDSGFTGEYEKYLGTAASGGNRNLGDMCSTLSNIESETGIRPALIYAAFLPEGTLTGAGNKSLESDAGDRPPQANDQLELVLVTAQGLPIRKRIEGATRANVVELANTFRREVSDGRKIRTKSYLKPAQALYQLLIAPLESDLQTRKVENLAFILDAGLRSLPLAALHDGKEFLVEKYSLGLMPSINLTDTRYVDIRKSQVLAMGASEFSDLNPLPAVPAELSILSHLWQGESFLNQDFTLNNLKTQREKHPFGIIHLATHGEFLPGNSNHSFIRLWDKPLRLSQFQELGLNYPPAQLLVLSACRTALGDRDAELGFAGMAVQSGAKSALGSLWYVSDVGTLALMSEFYDQLRQLPTKAEALRQAQIALLKGQVKFEDGRLQVAGQPDIPLPQDLVGLSNSNLTHPYFWSPFTLVGNPW
ncbi:MAG: CHAT domain-containing protein [Scytolyngbya sp. HA4215-MV1]|jgi:filamentous hemagglutinin family protein|nr:CHAT domain-containing protein [Scytolyngbya sp. HA4215-MV1]